MSEQTGSWQPDPFGRHQYRYWDGAQWSDQVSNDGVVQTDPPVGDPAAGVTESPAAEQPAADEQSAAAEPPADAEPDPAPVTEQPGGWAASSEPDATSAMPAASYPPPAPAPAAGAPGGPSDPIYRGDQPADSGGGGKRSKAPIVIIILILLALAAGAAAYFLLMDDEDEARGELISALQDEDGLSESQAECIVDELDDDLDLGELADAIENDDEPTPAQMSAAFAAFGECDVDMTAAPGGGGGDDPTSTSEDTGDDTATDDDDSFDEDDPSTTDEDDPFGSDGDDAFGPGDVEMPPGMIAMLAPQIAEELGISDEQAECLIEGIFSGEGFDSMLTDPESFDPESMDNAFALFEDCGVDPADLE